MSHVSSMLAAAEGGTVTTVLTVYVACISVFCLYLMLFWGVYRKAGRPTWVAFVPLLNVVEMVKLLKMPAWWLSLFLVPIVNVFMFLELAYRLSKAFGYGWGLTLATMVIPYVVGPYLSLSSAVFDVARIPVGGKRGPALP